MRRAMVWVPFLVMLLSSAGDGQTLRTTASNPDSALHTILSGMAGDPLTLRDALHGARDRSPSVVSAEANYRSARGALRRESGAYDPILFFDFLRVGQEQPTASFFSGAPILNTRQTNSSGGLRMNLPTGTRLEASISAVTLESNSAFANLNPQYTTLGNLSVRQPLLGGFWVSAHKNVARAEKEEDAARAAYDQELVASDTRVELMYWDLYAAVRDYAVEKLTRDRAEAFLRDTETRARTGLIGPNQVANARTFLAEQEILLLNREEDLDRLSDELAAAIGVRPETGHVRFLAVDIPPDSIAAGDVDLLVEEAKIRNRGLRQAKALAEASRVSANAAAWEILPRLDFVASYGGNGLGGSAQDVIFNGDTLHASRSGSFNDAIHQSIRAQFPTWSVGVEFSMPILLRSGRGEAERLEAEVIIADQRVVQIERTLEAEIRSRHREIANGARRLLAAREGVDAAQEQARIGLVEFRNGRATAFELVRLGADFAIAQQRYSQALVHSAKAAAALRELTSGEAVLPGQ
jgi:outer membrane protein